MKAQIELLGDREIVMSRKFAAPPSLVFEAWTKPELMRQWYAPEGWTLEGCEVDLRPGGEFRFETVKPGGKHIVQKGFYREVVPCERLVHTEEWEDWQCGEIVVAITFAGTDTTLMTSRQTYPSREVRDQLVKFGMTDNVEVLYGKLDDVLLQLANSPGDVR